jgi:hypothetical protein
MIIKPRWYRILYGHLFGWALWTTDRLPWFARKRIFNWMLGKEYFTDFHQADQVLSGAGLACIKW